MGHQADGDTIEPRLLRYPAIHGDTIVFNYAGDLWVSTKAGGVARRLTSHPGNETRPKISPDGTTVAFTGSYDGAPNIYTVPIEGGEPKRLTYDNEGDNCIGWTPDGKIAFGTSAATYTIGRQQRLLYVDPKGGMPTTSPIMEIAEASFFPDGKTIAYTRFNSYAFNWRHYRGGSQGRISMYDTSTNSYSELPSGREQSYFPMVIGRSIYYVSDKNLGTLNLYKYDLDKKSDTQLTKYTDADVRYPSTDGKTIVFERDGYLFGYDVAGNKVSKYAPLVKSENLSARPYLRSLGNQISALSVSPSGARVAVEARGELFSVPAKAGDTRNLTNSSASRERFPNWSPDGKAIAYISDATGETEIYTQPQLGGTPTQLTTAKLPIDTINWSPDGKMILFVTGSHDTYILDVATKKLTKVMHADYEAGGGDWSPDSKWIAYCNAGPNLLASVYLYEVESGKTTRITDGLYSDGDVSFDQNGKYLYITSNRTFSPGFGNFEFSLKVEGGTRVYLMTLSKDTPNPLYVSNEEEPDAAPTPPVGGPGKAPPKPPVAGNKIDIDGIQERMVVLPVPAGSYGIAGSNNGVFIFTPGGGISKFDLASRENQPLGAGFLGQTTFNTNRTKLAYNVGGMVGIVDVHPGMAPGQGRVDTNSVEAMINPRDEWKQIFWEAWRFERDHYYDENMRGLNWLAIGKRYEGYLPFVAHRNDLNYVLGMMIGELGTGHSYVIGGDMGAPLRPIPVGRLGADYEVVGNYIKFKKIYGGGNFDEATHSPLTEPGVDVKAGDYLLDIDGQTVTANTNPDSLMLNKVGRYVTLTVNGTPTVTGARKVRVKPILTEGRLRYFDFVESNRKKVAEMSGGRIGYMHIENTQTDGAIGFIKGFYSQSDKDAMLVDERWNGGGFIQPWFVDTLKRDIKAGIQRRNSLDSADEQAIEGPKALLINGYAGSGGDFFPWMFKHENTGPLIGKRTWGGLVGISAGAPLVDGGSVTAPEFAIYDRESNEIIAENRGVDPDIDVDMRPDLVAKGQDPQLEAGVKYLLEQLKKNPPRKARVKLPEVGKQGRINP